MSNTINQKSNLDLSTSAGQVPEYRVLKNLLNEVYVAVGLGRDNALQYALAWLAIGRMLTRRQIPGYHEIQELLSRDCWMAAQGNGFPVEAISMVWPDGNTARNQDGSRVRILSVLTEFLEQYSDQDWDIADATSEFGGTYEVGYDGGLCDAIVDLLEPRKGANVWIPFDVSGQLTCRALRKGLKVTLAGPGKSQWTVLMAQLLALIEGKAENLQLEYDPKSVSEFDSNQFFDYLIACPPIGMKVIPGAGWHRWDSFESELPGAEAIYRKVAGQNYVELDRAESWAIAAFLPRVKQRAVFLTGPNVLFAKGQEQRLREFLVHGVKQPAAVVMLPPKLLHHAGINTALTLFNREHLFGSVRMVDASLATIESNSTMGFSRQLDAVQVVKLVHQQEEVEGISKDVAMDQIASQECNLMPVRYLKALQTDDGSRVVFGDLVETVIRAPVASKEATATEVQEVGIADLGKWTQLQGPFAKSTMVQSKKVGECRLQPGDIIVSIKGTIGKVGLIGVSETPDGAVVCAQNVIAIRPKRNQVNPIALYLYLRSEDFKNQLEAFRVGVAVAHITPATLLQDVKVPLTLLLEGDTAEERFAELCALESEVDRANQRIEEIRSSL